VVMAGCYANQPRLFVYRLDRVRQRRSCIIASKEKISTIRSDRSIAFETTEQTCLSATFLLLRRTACLVRVARQ